MNNLTRNHTVYQRKFIVLISIVISLMECRFIKFITCNKIVLMFSINILKMSRRIYDQGSFLRKYFIVILLYIAYIEEKILIGGIKFLQMLDYMVN
uniref:Putative product n=1 Tax=Xenopsylla cheopis TaxID=163159 RepID=A0A6M2DX08_XENCH